MNPDQVNMWLGLIGFTFGAGMAIYNIVSKKLEKFEDRLNLEEKATIRQDGQIEVVKTATLNLKENHDNHKSDLKEVLSQINRKLEEISNRQRVSGSSGQTYSQVRPGDVK